jgi:hypothetical protein
MSLINLNRNPKRKRGALANASGYDDDLSCRGKNIGLVLLGPLAIVLLGLLWWFDPSEVRLPLCSFHALTGRDCPGCGATRATHELLHGHLRAAWRYNALWVLLLPVAIYAAISEVRFLGVGHPLPGNLPRQKWFWVAIVAAEIVFFVLRNLRS